MNRKQLALKVSKHPIIELLKKDKSLTSSDIARLIVEELLSENSVENYVKKLEAAQNPEELEGVKKEMDDWEPYWYTTYNNLRGRYNERKQELENVKSTSQQQIKNILTRLANMLKNNNLLGENINKLVKVLNIKNTSLFGQKLAKEFNRQELSVLKAFLEKEENIQLAAGLLKKYATPADNPPNEPTEEQPQSEYKGLEALGLGDNEKLFITFLNKLKELNLIKEIEDKSYEKISRLYSEGITKVLRTFQEEEQKKLLGILSNEKILEFVKKIMVQPQQEPKEEPEQQEQPPEESPEKKEEDFTPDEDNIKPFISAVNIFQQEFYKQRKRKNQAKIINAVIDSIDKLVDDTNLEDAYVEVSQEEQELEEGIRDKIVDKAMSYFGDKSSERRGNEPVKTKKEEIKDFRAEFRTFLQRVNKTNKALEVFKKYADQGSALADDTKEDFMQLLKKLQQSIVRIINNIRKSLPKAEIQENEADPKLAKHQEVSQKYRKALKSLASLRDLLSDKPTSEKPEELIKNSYQELIDLSQHFPSVNPFNVGVKSKKDLKKYDAAFDSAVKNVKASLQNVLSFIKTFESDSDTLEFAIEGLEEFSAKIQSIFGVKSLLKSAQASESEEAARVSEPGSSDTSSPDKPSEEPSGEPSGGPTGEPSGGPTGEPSGGPTGEPSGDERIEVEPWWDEKEEKMVAGSVNAEEIKVFDKFLKLLKSDQLNESDIGEFEKSIGNNKAIDRAIAEKIKATYNKLNDAEKAVMDRLFKKEDIFKAMVNAVVRKYPSNRTDSSNISVDDLDITPQSPEDNSRSASEDDPSANPENPGGNGSQLTEEQAIIMTNIANYVTSLGAGSPNITVNTLDDYGNDASIIISPEDAFVFYSTPDGTIKQKNV